MRDLRREVVNAADAECLSKEKNERERNSPTLPKRLGGIRRRPRNEIFGIGLKRLPAGRTNWNKWQESDQPSQSFGGSLPPANPSSASKKPPVPVFARRKPSFAARESAAKVHDAQNRSPGPALPATKQPQEYRQTKPKRALAPDTCSGGEFPLPNVTEPFCSSIEPRHRRNKSPASRCEAEKKESPTNEKALSIENAQSSRLLPKSTSVSLSLQQRSRQKNKKTKKRKSENGPIKSVRFADQSGEANRCPNCMKIFEGAHTTCSAKAPVIIVVNSGGGIT